MDAYRQSLDHELRRMREQAHAAFENPNDPRARAMFNELHKAEELNQMGRGLRDVHNSLEAAQRLMRETHNLPHGQQVMNQTHLMDFDHRIEHLRTDIRSQDHYN